MHIIIICCFRFFLRRTRKKNLPDRLKYNKNKTEPTKNKCVKVYIKKIKMGKIFCYIDMFQVNEKKFFLNDEFFS